MPPSPDQFSQWKSVLQGKNTADILNTMEEIVREGGWDALGDHDEQTSCEWVLCLQNALQE